MLNPVFPQRIDNTYRGHPLALWFFGLVLLSKTGIALATIFNGRTAAQSADGIPIDNLAPVARKRWWRFSRCGDLGTS